jgi:hypothetical protein
MKCSKKDVLEKLYEKLKELPDVELVFLYNNEFMYKSPRYRVVDLVQGKFIKLSTNEEVERTFLIDFIIKELFRENKNHSTVMVLNSIRSDFKVKYLGNDTFHLMEVEDEGPRFNTEISE